MLVWYIELDSSKKYLKKKKGLSPLYPNQADQYNLVCSIYFMERIIFLKD